MSALSTHPKGGEARLTVDAEWHRGEAGRNGLALDWRTQFKATAGSERRCASIPARKNEGLENLHALWKRTRNYAIDRIDLECSPACMYAHQCDLVSRNGHVFKQWLQLAEVMAHAEPAPRAPPS